VARHIVKSGESLARIARHYGFRDWRLIYDHPDNADFRERRPDPDVLFPGDTVVIPEKEIGSASIATGALHRFRVKAPRRVLRIRMLKPDGEPLKAAEYTLSYAGGEIEGETNDEGLIDIEVPPDLTGATLLIDGDEHRLLLEHLDPVRDTPDEGERGARSRLSNMGYDVPPKSPDDGAAMARAIRAFQADHGLDPSGVLDGGTVDKLVAEHGC
jgi:N-acetylmuramoyl-L-alanine amidase